MLGRQCVEAVEGLELAFATDEWRYQRYPRAPALGGIRACQRTPLSLVQRTSCSHLGVRSPDFSFALESNRVTSLSSRHRSYRGTGWSARLVALRELGRLGSERCQVGAEHCVQQVGPLNSGGTDDLAQLQAAQAGGYNVIR